MVVTIGNAVLLWNRLTIAEIIPPTANRQLPNNADALPAFLVKGAKESAVAFGPVIPWPQKKTNIIAISVYTLNN